MARKRSVNNKRVAARLVGSKPLAYKLREDGVLVVIGEDGRKSTFTPDQVRAARKTEDSAETSGEQ